MTRPFPVSREQNIHSVIAGAGVALVMAAVAQYKGRFHGLALVRAKTMRLHCDFATERGYAFFGKCLFDMDQVRHAACRGGGCSYRGGDARLGPMRTRAAKAVGGGGPARHAAIRHGSKFYLNLSEPTGKIKHSATSPIPRPFISREIKGLPKWVAHASARRRFWVMRPRCQFFLQSTPAIAGRRR